MESAGANPVSGVGEMEDGRVVLLGPDLLEGLVAVHPGGSAESDDGFGFGDLEGVDETGSAGVHL